MEWFIVTISYFYCHSASSEVLIIHREAGRGRQELSSPTHRNSCAAQLPPWDLASCSGFRMTCSRMVLVWDMGLENAASMTLLWQWNEKKKINKKVDWSDGLQEDRVWKVENQLQGVQTILSCQQCRACMIYISKNFIEHLHFKKGSASLRCFFILTLILYLVGSEMHQKLNSTGQ